MDETYSGEQNPKQEFEILWLIEIVHMCEK